MTDDQQLADFVEWMTLQRDAERSLAERHGHSSTPMLRRAEFGLALVARVRAAEKRVSEVESVAHLNQSDAIYAQDRAAFLDKMLQKEREQNRAAQSRIAQLEAELYERDRAAMERG